MINEVQIVLFNSTFAANQVFLDYLTGEYKSEIFPLPSTDFLYGNYVLRSIFVGGL